MRRVSFIIATVFFTVMLTGCISRQQREENRKNLLRAEKNAVIYIKDKYGFTADITNSNVESVGGLFGAAFTGYAFIEMEHKGKEFTVYIDGETANKDGRDNYQEEDIKEFVENKLYEKAEIKCDNISMQNYYNYKKKENMDNYYLLYNTYFNGDNFDELYEERRFYCAVSCFGETDISYLNEETMKTIFGENYITVFSYNYGSPDSDWYNKYNELASVVSYNNYKYKYGMYISEAISYKYYKNGSKYDYFKPIVQNCGDISYITENNAIIDLYETTPDEPENWNNRGAVNAQIVSKAYSLPTSKDIIWIYFDKRKLPENGKNCNIALSWLSDNDARGYSTGSLTYDCGDYLVSEITPQFEDYYCVVIHDDK